METISSLVDIANQQGIIDRTSDQREGSARGLCTEEDLNLYIGEDIGPSLQLQYLDLNSAREMIIHDAQTLTNNHLDQAPKIYKAMRERLNDLKVRIEEAGRVKEQ